MFTHSPKNMMNTAVFNTAEATGQPLLVRVNHNTDHTAAINAPSAPAPELGSPGNATATATPSGMPAN